MTSIPFYRTCSRRRAFTLLELLVVIGIILILVAMATIGLHIVQNTAAGRATRTTEENLRALIDELGATNGTGLLDAVSPVPAAGTNPGDVSIYDSSHTARYQDQWVRYTQSIMNVLLRVPKNKQAVMTLPSRQLLPAASAGSPAVTISVDANGNPNPPIILDAWHNPIIYVPSTGVTVNVGGVSKLIQARDGRPFWASAGPDGDFLLGDDNIYSFEAR